MIVEHVEGYLIKFIENKSQNGNKNTNLCDQNWLKRPGIEASWFGERRMILLYGMQKEGLRGN